MERNLNIIENCFIRENKKCGRVLNGSKMSFIATPAADYVQLELEIIRSKLKAFEIEPYVAVEHRAFGKDVFCEKICGKIIESLFCIVLLNDRTESINGKAISIPNPNVYYEYGLMTSLNKKIIPLQKEHQRLAFNIQSLDTIKYNDRNFASEVEGAIKSIFIENEQIEEKPQEVVPKELSVYLGLSGINWPQINRGDDFETALMIGHDLGFLFLVDFTNNIPFFLKILENDEEEKDIVIYIKGVLKRIEGIVANILRKMRIAEGAELFDGKIVTDEKLTQPPELKRQIKIMQFGLHMFSRPKILIYRENYSNKKNIINSYEKVKEGKVKLKPELVLLDKNKITSLIERASEGAV